MALVILRVYKHLIHATHRYAVIDRQNLTKPFVNRQRRSTSPYVISAGEEKSAGIFSRLNFGDVAMLFLKSALSNRNARA
jgi:hypothetical protein